MQIHLVWWLLLLSPAAFSATNATVKQPTSLLVQPTPDAAELAQLPAAERVAVLTRQGGWYQVTPPDKPTGWLRLFSVQFVKERYQPDNLPLQDLSGLVQGSRQQVTSSTGVRGLDKVAITKAAPDFDKLIVLQRLQQPAAQAQAFADVAKLKIDTNIPVEVSNK